MVTFDPTMPDEAWYPIPSIPGYEVSSHYRVRRWVTRGGKPLPDGPVPVTVRVRPGTGYRTFEGRYRQHYLHRVVKEVAVGHRLGSAAMVLHDDDDRSNNHPSNLKIGDHPSNVADAHRNGRYAKGGPKPMLVLDPEKVRRAIERHGEGEKIAALAREFGVHYMTMYRAINGLSWKGVS